MKTFACKNTSTLDQKKRVLVAAYLAVLLLLIGLASSLAQADEIYEVTPILPQELWDEEDKIDFEVSMLQDEIGDEQHLDDVLAPIALYPDPLLSHILMAATHRLEVIEALRWRQEYDHLSAEEALAAVEDKPWDPSVKALVAFEDLLERLSDDIDWLQDIGDAF